MFVGKGKESSVTTAIWRGGHSLEIVSVGSLLNSNNVIDAWEKGHWFSPARMFSLQRFLGIMRSGKVVSWVELYYKNSRHGIYTLDLRLKGVCLSVANWKFLTLCLSTRFSQVCFEHQWILTFTEHLENKTSHPTPIVFFHDLLFKFERTYHWQETL